MKPRILIIHKPVTLRRPELEGKLQSMLSERGRIIEERQWDPAPIDRMKELYEEHEGRFFYRWLFELFQGEPLKTSVYEPEYEVEVGKNGLMVYERML